MAAFQVTVAAVDTVDDIPGRFAGSGLDELVEALGGHVGDDEDVWQSLRRAFEALAPTELGERLLDLVLLQPPIPAGCDALVRAMKDPATFPWRDHEVAEDRVWLWYAHRLLHKSLPDQYPAPTAIRVDVVVTPLSADARLPGRRTAPHDRTEFVARLLRARPGADDLAALDADDLSWAFDVLWWVVVGDRTKLDPAALADIGASPDAPGLQVTLSAWLPEAWRGGLEAGQAWTAQL